MQLRLIRCYSTKFSAGEYVAIQPLKQTTTSKTYLTKLQPGQNYSVTTGHFKHNDIIGSHSRSVIYVHKGSTKDTKYVVSKPTTEEYVNLIKRDAQPIYPMDAAAIVNLADLHIDYPNLTPEGKLSQPPLQFLEAGTGHGSLALQIVKAIHPANCFVKQLGMDVRGAVLHSIDCNPKHSKTGSKTVKEFKNGMYANDVEFHLSESPTTWLQNESQSWVELSRDKDEQQLEFEDKNAFLSGVFLDMGGFEKQLPECAKHLKLDAPLVIFCPSVTQVMDAVRIVDETPEMNLQFVKTVQLLDGAGGGLKEWDTRKAVIRATGEAGWVCRPKVGIRVCGGGFVVIFRKGATKMVETVIEKVIYEPRRETNQAVVKKWWEFWK
ncbi:hypothetical protein CANARDRAFT_28844 [[Candida] arabinofermentans NRRL YB-2248]|uniref:tRNA (adenine(58)-N(1))-methyltransferase catalytic subunit TRM61 n=1 Tax=[Candida] arabinofermentans NRRL YB-2248 TaxID=983967 RepID=A0A1E4SYU8_9ASCO|nr:hypothetical protein CANARDRAFT_28844 [[Candida] arabinofermentans NRRL YB-2248]